MLEMRRETRYDDLDLEPEFTPPLAPRLLLLGVKERLRADGLVHVPLDEAVFFFQAEDGIRALYVTGVKTCALPISSDSVRPADASAARTTRCCAAPLGAVSPLDAPSELTADPRSTANTVCPLRIASDCRSSSSKPAPSPQIVPSAPSANGLHRPSGARPRLRLKLTNALGVLITVAPPATASEQSPDRNAAAARWMATSDGEHAGVAVPQGVRVDAGAFEQLERRLQQQPLLRVHGQRLTRRDAERRRVEVRDAVEEAAAAGVGVAGAVGVVVDQVVQVPVTVGGKLRRRVDLVEHQPPQVFRRQIGRASCRERV